MDVTAFVLNWPFRPGNDERDSLPIVGKLLIVMSIFSWMPLTVVGIGLMLHGIAYLVLPRRAGHEANHDTPLGSIMYGLRHEPGFVLSMLVLGLLVLGLFGEGIYLMRVSDAEMALGARLP